MLELYRDLISDPPSQLTHTLAFVDLMFTMSPSTVREDSQVTNTYISGLATLENPFMYILPHNAHHLRLLV